LSAGALALTILFQKPVNHFFAIYHCARSAATEWREKVAHGASRGLGGQREKLRQERQKKLWPEIFFRRYAA